MSLVRTLYYTSTKILTNSSQFVRFSSKFYKKEKPYMCVRTYIHISANEL